jgi:hypothetical protein
VLQPCLRAEQLLVTVDTHTGMLQCHVPQYDAPLIPELQTALNGDHSRLPTLVSELRYVFNIILAWTCKKCSKFDKASLVQYGFKLYKFMLKMFLILEENCSSSISIVTRLWVG